MHNPYDVMAKGLLEGTLSGPCEVRTEEEVVTDAKAMDTVVVPDPTRLAELDGRGLFGRFARDAQQVCVFEAYQEPPSPDETDYCLLRVTALQAKKYAAWKARPASERGVPPVRARLCLVSAGSPDAARKEWALVQRPGWPTGCLWTGSARGPYVIVVSELPRTQETLMARMMGKDDTLLRAYDDLHALPEDAWERRAAASVLVTLRRDLQRMGLPGYTRSEDVMGIYQEGLKLLEEERREARAEGMRAPLLHLFERRLRRALTEDERATVLARLGVEGPVRLSDVVLDLDGAQLAAWLADPDAR